MVEEHVTITEMIDELKHLTGKSEAQIFAESVSELAKSTDPNLLLEIEEAPENKLLALESREPNGNVRDFPSILWRMLQQARQAGSRIN